MIICQVCKSENEDFASFCFNCGSALFPSFTTAPPLVLPILPAQTAQTPLKPVSYTPLRPAPLGMCFYHSNLPAAYICSRCGRQICRSCAKPYFGLVFCAPCFTRIRV
ncbi:MAG: hypothetical protein QW589_00500 [Candidatus Bathyarchaeia archaeon]